MSKNAKVSLVILQLLFEIIIDSFICCSDPSNKIKYCPIDTLLTIMVVIDSILVEIAKKSLEIDNINVTTFFYK